MKLRTDFLLNKLYKIILNTVLKAVNELDNLQTTLTAG